MKYLRVESHLYEKKINKELLLWSEFIDLIININYYRVDAVFI